MVVAQEYRLSKRKGQFFLEYYEKDSLVLSQKGSVVTLINGIPYNFSFLNNKFQGKVGLNVQKLKAGDGGFYVEDNSLTIIGYRDSARNCIESERFINSINVLRVKKDFFVLSFANRTGRIVKIKVPMALENRAENKKLICDFIYTHTDLYQCIRCE